MKKTTEKSKTTTPPTLMPTDALKAVTGGQEMEPSPGPIRYRSYYRY